MTYRKECHCRHDASVLLAGDLVDDLARISSLLLGWPANARSADRTFRRHFAVVLCVVIEVEVIHCFWLPRGVSDVLVKR